MWSFSRSSAWTKFKYYLCIYKFKSQLFIFYSILLFSLGAIHVLPPVTIPGISVESLTLSLQLTVCSYHVTYAFQSEYTLYSCLIVKELLAPNRREIWSLSDCNGTRTHYHLVCKRTLNHLTKLAKWLSCVVNTYVYSAFDCMFLSCHLRVSEWIPTL